MAQLEGGCLAVGAVPSPAPGRGLRGSGRGPQESRCSVPQFPRPRSGQQQCQSELRATVCPLPPSQPCALPEEGAGVSPGKKSGEQRSREGAPSCRAAGAEQTEPGGSRAIRKRCLPRGQSPLGHWWRLHPEATPEPARSLPRQGISPARLTARRGRAAQRQPPPKSNQRPGAQQGAHTHAPLTSNPPGVHWP